MEHGYKTASLTGISENMQNTTSEISAMTERRQRRGKQACLETTGILEEEWLFAEPEEREASGPRRPQVGDTNTRRPRAHGMARGARGRRRLSAPRTASPGRSADLGSRSRTRGPRSWALGGEWPLRHPLQSSPVAAETPRQRPSHLPSAPGALAVRV